MDPAVIPEPQDTLRDRVGRGLGWSFVNNVVARLTNVLVGVVLARILVPEDYGIFAASIIMVNAALSMNELGVSLAVVRWPGSPARIAPTVTMLSAVWSLVLYACCWVAAPSVAVALGSPGAVGLIRILGICILVDAVAAVPAALMTRAFMQRERMVIDVICLVVSSGLSIGLALAGLGVTALAAGLLASSVLSGLLTMAFAPERYGPGFDGSVVRELLHFGLPLAGASALVFLTLNIDYVVVGGQLGAEALGFYTLAFNVCSWPVTLITVAIRRVSFAGFSRAAESAGEASRAFVTSGALVLALTLPLSALLAAYAGPTIEAVYGPRWIPAAEALVLLCVLGSVRVLLDLGYDFLAAVGHTRANLAIQGVWFGLLIPVLAVGARLDGIRGVAAGHAVLAVVVILPLFLWFAARAGADIGHLCRQAARPLLAVVVVLASAWAMRLVLPSPWPLLLVGGAVSGVLAVTIVWPMRRLALPGLSPTPAADAKTPVP